MICDCGMEIKTKNHMSVHIETSRHKRLLELKKLQDNSSLKENKLREKLDIIKDPEFDKIFDLLSNYKNKDKNELKDLELQKKSLEDNYYKTIEDYKKRHIEELNKINYNYEKMSKTINDKIDITSNKKENMYDKLKQIFEESKI